MTESFLVGGKKERKRNKETSGFVVRVETNKITLFWEKERDEKQRICCERNKRKKKKDESPRGMENVIRRRNL